MLIFILDRRHSHVACPDNSMKHMERGNILTLVTPTENTQQNWKTLKEKTKTELLLCCVVLF